MIRAFILRPLEDPLRCIGDVNGDGVINVFDLLALLGAWGDCPLDRPCPADLDGNGVVNVFDLLILLGNWGQNCPGFAGNRDVPSREDETSAVGITEQRWSDFLDVLTNEPMDEQERWICWFERRITQCQTCRPCRGSDPFT